MKYARRKDPLYHIWKSMRGRCMCKTNSRYKDYGGKGVVISREWDDFEKFKSWSHKNGYKQSTIPNTSNSMSLDRIDSDGGYFPENCRWVTKGENSRLKTSSLDDKIDILEKISLILQINIGNDYI